MKLKALLTLLTLVMFIVFSGCGGGGSDSPSTETPTTISTGITGTVSDMSGNPLEGATVFVGSTKTLTDENGEFTISTEASEVSLSAELENYVQNSRVVSVTSGKLAEQNLKLSKVGTVKSFDASSGASIKSQDATVDLPTNSYVLDDGSAYTGEVTAKVTYNRVTTVTGKEAFPGEFIGQESDSNETKVLQSYGFINVTLESEDGKDLNLADNSKATLTYPMDSNIEDTPATIPLWYFDTTKGIWIEDGVATYDATTNTYSGTVTHFSTWNLDKKFDGATLKGCVEDATGEKVTLSDIYISAAGWSKNVRNSDANGEFEFINAPSGITLSIVAKVDDLSSAEQNVTLSSGESKTMDDCLSIDINASEVFANVKGKLVDGDNNAVTNQSIYISSIIDGTTNNFSSVYTDSKGEFIFTFKRSNIDNIKLSTYKWVNSQYITFDNSYEIDPAKSVTDVGSIVLATTTVNACVTLESGSSTSSEGVTTLADGTTVDDGTTVSSDGFTTFGSNTRELASTSAYNIDYYSGTFSESGMFTYTFKQDNLAHTLYAHVYDSEGEKYTLTGKLDVLANETTKNLTDANECIQLHKMKTVSSSTSASISTTNSNVYLEVSFAKGYSFHGHGDNLIDSSSKLKSGSFELSKNGTYTVRQVADNYEHVAFNGTVTLKIGSDTYTLTIPSDTTANAEWWTAYTIEVYDGDIKVTEVNKAW